MALLFKKEEPHFKLGIWKIEEGIDFFENQIPYRSASVHEGRQLQQLATRYLLAHLHDDFPVASIQVIQNGKPFVPNNDLQFNLSHTSELAVAILSKTHHVGIDAERINQRVVKVKHKFLGTAELEGLTGNEEAVYLSYLTKYWAIKEAVYKWWGKGAVDFANDIRIQKNSLLAEQVVVNFGKEHPMDLAVHCFQLEEHWLAYVVK